jgi:putative spermidine/putrescine transport system ATP-binding protein
VVSAAQGCLTVDGQQISVSQKLENHHDAEQVSISLRPERVSLVGEVRKPNTLDCIVEAITFLGSIVRVRVRTGDNSFVADEFNNPFLALPKIGDKVQVTFSREAPLILKRSVAG